MGNCTRKPDDQTFGQWLRSVRPDTEPPPGSKERVLRKVLAALDAQQRPTPARRPNVSPPQALRLRGWLPRFGLTAVGTLLVVAALCWVLGGNVRTASADFRQMLEKVRQATTITCNFIVQVGGKMEGQAEVAMVPGRSRATWDDGRIHITDQTSGQMLTLSPDNKRAVLSEFSSNAAYEEAIDSLRELSVSAGRWIGWEKISDRDVEVYDARGPHGPMRIWVNPSDSLPVRMEIRSHAEAGQEMVTVLDDIRWDLPLADTLFAMDVPAGYSLERPGIEGKEEDLRQLLHMCAESNEGQFPAILDAETVFQLMLKSTGASVTRVPQAEGMVFGDMDERTKEVFRKHRRGLAFLAQVQQAADWRYVGDGVKLGDSAAPVCWWRPAGATTYRVLYGDLHAENAAEVPEIQSDPLTGSPNIDR